MYYFLVLGLCSVCFFFFFQAEDGIRDPLVTEFRRVLFRSFAAPAGESGSVVFAGQGAHEIVRGGAIETQRFGSQFRLGPRNFRRSDGEHEELRRRATRIQESGRGGAAAGGHALPLGERLLVAEHVGCGNGAVSRRTRKRSLELHGAVENREHHSGAARRFVPSVGGSPKSSG